MRKIIVCVVAVLCLSCATAAAQSKQNASENFDSLWSSNSIVPAHGKTNRKLKPLDDLFTSFLKKNQMTGVTVAVSYRKRLIYQRGFGYAQLDPKVEMKADSLMRIASVSKPITGVAIMRLVDKGKLELDQKVFEILDHRPLDPANVEPRSADITVRHLLHHTAGYDRDASWDPMFRDFPIAEAFGKKGPPVNTDEIIRYMLSQPLDFDPGAKYAYSNYGYCLLGRVVEKVTGESYAEYVSREILKPIGVKRMQIGKTLEADLAEGEVRYHSRKKLMRTGCVAGVEGQTVPRQYGGFNISNMDSHGAWIASAADLVKFANELNVEKRCKWMKAESVRQLFAQPDYLGLKAVKGKSLRYYGFGWRVVASDRGTNTYHKGALTGTSTLLVRRYDGCNWAILFNARRTIDGKEASGAIDSLMHRAVNAVKKNLRLK